MVITDYSSEATLMFSAVCGEPFFKGYAPHLAWSV